MHVNISYERLLHTEKWLLGKKSKNPFFHNWPNMHIFLNINYLHKQIIQMCAYAFLKLLFINEDRKVENRLGHIKKIV